MEITVPINANTFTDSPNTPEHNINEYFSRLNNGEFMATAELFAEEGYLHPPFEQPIQGRKAIAQYLETEAQGMKFWPAKVELLTNDSLPETHHERQQPCYQIHGQVETKWFTVNVAWLIQLNMAGQIAGVKIELLAALQDLLSFNYSLSIVG
jgi:Nuclear transport factor 2 (NTF2) domain